MSWTTTLNGHGGAASSTVVYDTETVNPRGPLTFTFNYWGYITLRRHGKKKRLPRYKELARRRRQRQHRLRVREAFYAGGTVSLVHDENGRLVSVNWKAGGT